MLNLDALRTSIEADVEALTRRLYPAEHRDHLGASLAGHECDRYLWNTFRHLLLEEHEGKQRRLFQRGHREEQQFVDLLRGIGWEVLDIDPATGTQFRIRGQSGHVGGSLDALVRPPNSNMWFVGEFKTHNEKSFKKLIDEGLIHSKPMHFMQMSSYGHVYQLEYGLYCAVNKNTDEIRWLPTRLDLNAGKYALERLEAIAGMQDPPRKLSETPAYWKCKHCHFTGICHSNEAPEKNCRSCRHAAPAANGEWHCNLHQENIPKTFIPSGCEQWQRLV